MSLVNLLANFPNYSARKVRRLAKQLSYLENVNSPEAKGIGQDLMEYNLLLAQTEAQLNDDVARDDSPQGRWWGAKDNPTTLIEAIDEISLMREDWVNLAIRLGFDTFIDPEQIFERITQLAMVENKTMANQVVERITVTPTSEAIRAIDEMKDLGRFTDEDGSLHVKASFRAKGIVSSSSFTATRITTHEDDGSVTVSHL